MSSEEIKIPIVNKRKSHRRMMKRRYPHVYCEHEWEYHSWRTTSGDMFFGDYVYPAVYKCKKCGLTECRKS